MIGCDVEGKNDICVDLVSWSVEKTVVLRRC